MHAVVGRGGDQLRRALVGRRGGRHPRVQRGGHIINPEMWEMTVLIW
jgi:hypothetical protein